MLFWLFLFLPAQHHHHGFRAHVLVHADNDVVICLDIVVVVVVLVVLVLLVLVVVGVGDVEDELDDEDDERVERIELTVLPSVRLQKKVN